MVRVITQETYDEVVKENMEEFEMTPDEAIKEAVAQFEAQGVDLSNIIKDLVLESGDTYLVSKTVETLKELYNDKNTGIKIIKELEILRAECNKDIAHRVRAGKDGAYNILIDLLNIEVKSKDKDINVINQIIDTLTCLMDMQPDLLDERGIGVMTNVLDNIKDEDTQILTLKWIKNCCTKHEMNRQKIFPLIVMYLKDILNTSKNPKKIRAALKVMRRLTLDDDIRVQFGKAHDHAKEMGAQMLDSLVKLMKEHSKSQLLVSDLMSTSAALLVRHELCKMASDSGAADILFSVLAENYENVGVITEAVKFVTALAGNDDVKRQLVKSGIVPVVVTLLSRHKGNPQATALILKCIAALTLREPNHSKQFLENDAPEVMIDSMKIHENNSAVQKNGCWAIRNMVARCREHNAKFHELGVESILNTAYEKFYKDFGFDIKSALRDLECDVKLDEQWTGKGVQMDN